MTNTAITLHRPSILGRHVFDDVFDNFFQDFPSLLRQTTQGYPVTDIYRDENNNTVMEFALAGFAKEELSIDIKQEKRSITVRGKSPVVEADASRRIARRSFEKTYVNFDNNLDLASVTAEYENGPLSIVIPPNVESQPLSVDIK